MLLIFNNILLVVLYIKLFEYIYAHEWNKCILCLNGLVVSANSLSIINYKQAVKYVAGVPGYQSKTNNLALFGNRFTWSKICFWFHKKPRWKTDSKPTGSFGLRYSK